MPIITEFAPAKLNLYLHITGRRPDGYHDLDSLVAFAGIGDTVALEPASDLQFVVEGRYAPALAHEPPKNNLVIKAVKSLAALAGKIPAVKLTLTKNLPVASGIGGGSSDAAAALRAIAKHWGLSLDDPRIIQAAAEHGQDVPVCVKIANNYITAEGTAPAPNLPHVAVVLMNPNKALPTPAVYKKFREGGFSFSPLARLTTTPADTPQLITELKARGNDLYEPARQLMPEIGSIITVLQDTKDCLLARMSGSGATCFGLYATGEAAKQAGEKIRALHPEWWVTESFIAGSGSSKIS
jgi:4-diphosphocytidyl-2-C-methyl-D-erythritol kinase